MIIVHFLINTMQGKLKITYASLKECEELDDISIVLGNYDIIAKGIFEDKEELYTFIQNKLQITDGIENTKTLIVME